eukprot:gb/GEZN01012677.1/.p1 GENE.gb/GEZN01012677.1/~~gb/GEZN01012677.1/.p1  ORF type:complete len:240 (-),score=22.41 gb/GEZN01012677.1/:120-839(-)
MKASVINSKTNVITRDSQNGKDVSNAEADQEGRKSSLELKENLVVGQWSDPSLLREETFDTILADYLIGSVDGFEPFTQHELVCRLKELMSSTSVLHLIGNEPFPVIYERLPGSHWQTLLEEPIDLSLAKLVVDTAAFRDSAQILAGYRPYREHPLSWHISALKRCGFSVVNVTAFPTLYGELWLRNQAELGISYARRIKSEHVRNSLVDFGTSLQANSSQLRRGVCVGMDFLITAKLA